MKSKYKKDLKCIGIGCEDRASVSYIFRFEGLPEHAGELSRWWYKKRNNINTYLACKNCIAKTPCPSSFLYVENHKMLLLMLQI
jgi:hypothetical protein